MVLFSDMQSFSRFVLSVSLILLSCFSGIIKADDALDTFLASKGLDAAHTAVYIWDIEGNRLVASYQETTPLIPASIMKCATTAALQSALPYNSTLDTDIYLQGELANGRFKGNLIIDGCGDPSLGDGRHEGHPDFIAELTGCLKEIGITEFEGDIVIDNSRFAGESTPASWMKEDRRQSYGTGFHAFNFRGNASGKAAVDNPSAIFIEKLKSALAEENISYTPAAIKAKAGSMQLLHSYHSPELSELMASCMFRSDNLYAESFLRLFGLSKGSDGSPDSSARAAMNHWKSSRHPNAGIKIVDGSGLSRSNRLTAEFLGSMLRDMASDPVYVSFFPLVGEEGTVRKFMSGSRLEAYLALKTGSMNGIQSYAGYLLNDDYAPTHVVVVIANGLKNRTEFRSALANYFLSLFQ